MPRSVSAAQGRGWNGREGQEVVLQAFPSELLLFRLQSLRLGRGGGTPHFCPLFFRLCKGLPGLYGSRARALQKVQPWLPAGGLQVPR